ncbi:MAG: AbrB family transcriptional regulator [Acidobacteriaceae bacterium]
MPETQTAKLFQNGRSQAVRLPREFRFSGDRVRIRKTPEGILLQPMISDVSEWFSALDDCGEGAFPKKDRNQPVTPSRRVFE